jgi:hypothetical protein
LEGANKRQNALVENDSLTLIVPEARVEQIDPGVEKVAG